VPSLKSVRESLKYSLKCRHPELRVLGDSLCSDASKNVKCSLDLLSISLKDLSSLGTAAEELIDLLRELSVLAFVLKNLAQAATPPQHVRRYCTLDLCQRAHITLCVICSK
jgi:hypothetical protein